MNFGGFVPPIFQIEFLVLFSLLCPQFLQDVVLNLIPYALPSVSYVVLTALMCLHVASNSCTFSLSLIPQNPTLFALYKGGANGQSYANSKHLRSAQSSQTFHVEDVKFGQSMKPIYLKKKTKF